LIAQGAALKWALLGPLPCASSGAVPGWLSRPERDRLSRIRAEHRRAQFVGGRWLLRTLLAECLGGDPRDWPLDAGHDGPPALLAPPVGAALHLALSHSADVLACAVAAMPVGIDVEAPRRARDLAGLAGLCFDPAEQAMLQGLAAPAQEAVFHALWTVKEAWLKSRAEPLAPRRLAQIHVRALEGGGPAQAASWGAEGWTLAVAAAHLGPVQWHAPVPGPQHSWAVRDGADAGRRGPSAA
jgi:4'-phosphopantetheinyl transferase